MSETTSKRRKHSRLQDNGESNSHAGDHGDASPSPEDLEIAELEHEVRDLGAKVVAYREKGLDHFARISEERQNALRRDAADHSRGLREAATNAAAAVTEGKKDDEKLMQSLRDRLAVANAALPALAKELAMWREKILYAMDVTRKCQRIPLLDDDNDEDFSEPVAATT